MEIGEIFPKTEKMKKMVRIRNEVRSNRIWEGTWRRGSTEGQ